MSNYSTPPGLSLSHFVWNQCVFTHLQSNRQTLPQGFSRERNQPSKNIPQACVATSNILYRVCVQRRGEWIIRQTKENMLASTNACGTGPQPLIDLSASLNDGGIQKTWATAGIDASKLFRNTEIWSLGWMNGEGKGRTGHWVSEWMNEPISARKTKRQTDSDQKKVFNLLKIMVDIALFPYSKTSQELKLCFSRKLSAIRRLRSGGRNIKI